MESLTHVVTKDLVLIHATNNKLCIQTILPNYSALSAKHILYGHHDQIYKLAINEGIDILLSVDRDNLVLVHYINSRKFLRSFTLEITPNEEVREVRIHDMGYFLFLTSTSRILLYSYFGELFLETDFVCLQEN